MPLPIPEQILAAYKALLIAAGTDAGLSVHIDRTDETPFEVGELPAINLSLLSETRAYPSVMGMAVGRSPLGVHELRLVQEVFTRGGPSAASAGRMIAMQCEQALASNPTLDGACSQGLLPRETQWDRDDRTEQKVFKTNVLLVGTYRAYTNDPTKPI